MIEIELKFLSPKNGIKDLLEGFTKKGSKTNSDIYFDTDEYALTAKEWWLRKRNNTYELKIPKFQTRTGYPSTIFEELESDEEIYSALALTPSGNGLDYDLQAAGYRAFAHLTTERTSYSNGSLTIDIDHVTSTPTDLSPYDSFIYDLVEIEIVVDNENEAAAKKEEIERFAQTKGLATGYIPGKVLAYIQKYNTEQYKILQINGIAP